MEIRNHTVDVVWPNTRNLWLAFTAIIALWTSQSCSAFDILEPSCCLSYFSFDISQNNPQIHGDSILVSILVRSNLH